MDPDTPADGPAGAPRWMQPYEHLTVAVEQEHGRRIAVVTLDLPQRRNAMSDPMTASWARLMAGLGEDPDLACVVVTGAGTAFCAGGDLSWIVADAGSPAEVLRARMITFYRTWLSITRLEVPTIAAVDGAAVGAGLALALACDVRYVAEDALLGVPFTQLGLHPGMGTTWTLAQVAGAAVARDLLLTGRMVSGEEAVGLGLASRALPRGQVLAAAMQAARSVAGAAPVATRLTTVALRGTGHGSLDDALQWEALAQAVTLATSDLLEGITAQRERRPARFTGR